MSNNRLPLDIQIDSKELKLDENDRSRILHEFFKYHEQQGTSIFSANNNFQFTYENKEYVISFPAKLIRYKSNKNNYVYTFKSDRSLGEGGFGSVSETEGKLSHSEQEGRMLYKRPDYLKANYPVLMLSMAGDIHTLNMSVMDELVKLAAEKFPILIKDEKGNVVVLARQKNQWKLFQLDKENFREIEFPPVTEPQSWQAISMNANQFSDAIQNELSIAHTRREKVVKAIAYENEADEKNTINESIIGRATRNRGTKKTTISRGYKADKQFQHGKTVIGHAHIVMDVVRGVPLSKINKDHIPLSYEQRCLLTANLLRALKDYHELGYVNRDIKSDNIMVDIENNMRVKLIDHGLARKLDSPDHRSLGTPLYISPEILAVPEKAGIESDIYSMGRVLKELWGDQEFKAESKSTMHEVLANRKNEYNNPYESTSETLKLAHNPQNKVVIPELLLGMARVKPESRISLDQALNILNNAGLSESVVKIHDLPRSQEILLEKLRQAEANINLILGDGRNGNKNLPETDSFSKDAFKKEIANIKDDAKHSPELMIQLYQGIFQTIYLDTDEDILELKAKKAKRGTLDSSEKFLYSLNDSNERFTGIQLKHINILIDEYVSYLKNLRVDEMDKPRLSLLKNQLERDQDVNNDLSINNFKVNKADTNINSFFPNKTTHEVVDEIINKVDAAINKQELKL